MMHIHPSHSSSSFVIIAIITTKGIPHGMWVICMVRSGEMNVEMNVSWMDVRMR